MLEKLQETLENDSDILMLKAIGDSTKAHAYATEAKIIMGNANRRLYK